MKDIGEPSVKRFVGDPVSDLPKAGFQGLMIANLWIGAVAMGIRLDAYMAVKNIAIPAGMSTR